MRPSRFLYDDQSSDEGSKGGYISTSGKRCHKSRISIPHAKDGTVMVNDDQVTISLGHLSDRDIVYRRLAEDASDSEGRVFLKPIKKSFGQQWHWGKASQFNLPLQGGLPWRTRGKTNPFT